MSRTRRARDSILGLMVALAPFAYKQWALGNLWAAGLTTGVVGGLFLAYRFADARMLRALAEAEAVDDPEAVGSAIETAAAAARSIAGRVRGRFR